MLKCLNLGELHVLLSDIQLYTYIAICKDSEGSNREISLDQ